MKPKLFDVIAILDDIPDHGLLKGQVGTLVEQLSEDTFEVEFSDNTGKTYAILPLATNHFIVLHYNASMSA
ncbi:MAG TPA: DUF4926 domain-containing protein [Candidatus Sumerlaeota bacterium]|nr:DUF4926 domain-containing protein [Candidatus Sumerlaeota bacterium]HQO02304.1 DUF4926 domain-containing protein [Spirochaetota bacterium]HQP50299.1 DUF4926 domain-containing protein [Spirochaetota bacterium]